MKRLRKVLLATCLLMAGVPVFAQSGDEHVVTENGVKSTFAMYPINYDLYHSAILKKAEREDGASLTTYLVPLGEHCRRDDAGEQDTWQVTRGNFKVYSSFRRFA